MVVNSYVLSCIYTGKDESKPAMLRSILAQMEYSYRVRYYDDNGVPFRTHLYVPEVHPLTGEGFCEREDEGHLLKVSSLDIYFDFCTQNRCLIIHIFIHRELAIQPRKVDLHLSTWSTSWRLFKIQVPKSLILHIHQQAAYRHGDKYHQSRHVQCHIQGTDGTAVNNITQLTYSLQVC